LENTAPEEKLAHSACVIKIIFMLFGAGRHGQFGRWCAEMSRAAVSSDLPETEKKRLAGELALLESFTRFNSIAKMGALMKRSHELLSGRPSLISMNDAWTFGSPSALFLYHAEPGRLDAELADMSVFCPYYHALTQGHGAGGDVLMRAEAHFNRGEIGDAEIQAHKAHYQSEPKKQACVGIGAALLLGRIAAQKGDAAEFLSVLKQRVAGPAKRAPLKSNRMEADMASAFLVVAKDMRVIG
jgi:LuxR family maltose regulon positive regulatory protein